MSLAGIFDDILPRGKNVSPSIVDIFYACGVQRHIILDSSFAGVKGTLRDGRSLL